MPPKPKFTKDEVVAAALALVRKGGIHAVTARDIAAELGVSTRPIFTYFDTMDEVKQALTDMAEGIYADYVRAGLREEIPFLGVGKQFIAFSREEPELYRLLFLSPSKQGASAVFEHTKQIVRSSVTKTYRIDESSADFYYYHLWIAVFGLAALNVADDSRISDEDISKMLTNYSVSFCKAIKEIPGFVAGDYDKDAVFHNLISK